MLRFGLCRYKSTLIKMAKRLKFDRNSVNSMDSFSSSCSVNVTESNKNINMNCSNNVKGVGRLPPPVKSQSDKKEYSVIQLSNGLTALLISDKSQFVPLPTDRPTAEENQCKESSGSESCSGSSEEDTDEEDAQSQGSDVKTSLSGCEEKLAACALCIGVGSFSDPENVPGLAHFLEHMIFMGSEKFPKENEFDMYIKKKGGSDNASTECEYTTYYFDCHEEFLHGALDIFSNLFISPIMQRKSMTKEREAIESEFQMSVSCDATRISQLLCSLADKSNPAHKFLWGNLITLRDGIKDDELYTAVHEFRKRHYSAHRMTLAVQGRLPLETLESWVIDCFEKVPNNDLPKDEFTLNVPPFIQHEFTKRYIIDPVKDIQHLDLTWVMPPTIQLYKTKPLEFIAQIIGHEGKGSLISYLRKKLWCLGISIRDGGDGTEENMMYTTFTISLVMSQKGLENIDPIINVVFDYINMFQREWPNERLFREVQQLAETRFRFAEEVSSAENVENLSECMQFYPSTDYLTATELYYDYDPDSIQSLLNELRVDNVNIMISSKILASSETLDKIEPWFGTKYTAKEIQPTGDKILQENTKDFYLPEVNPFIPSNFDILPAPNCSEYPKSIMKDDIMELWYKQDTTFKLPHAFCCLHLMTPLSYEFAQNAAMLDLFISVLKQYLIEELYPASVADFAYSFYSGEKGIVITVNGYNEKLKIVLKTFLHGMVSLGNNLEPDLVNILLNELNRTYSNSMLKPGTVGKETRMSILLEKYWTTLDKQKALKDINYESLKEFIPQYFKHLYVQCLIQGNISENEAISFGKLVKDQLACKPLDKRTLFDTRINQLPVGEKFCVVESFNAGDPNSIVTNYFQSGLGTIQEECIIEMLLMMMEEPLFDNLRTQEQLGYDVSCSLRDTFGILGFSVSVYCQTDRHKVEFVESRITNFLNDFLKTLKETSQEEFQEMQESLIKLKMCSDVHLNEEVKRNWAEIKNEEYIFDRLHKEKEYIEKLTLKDVIEWYEAASGVGKSTTCKKLSIQVVGTKSLSDKTQTHDDEQDVPILKELKFLLQQEQVDKFIFNIDNFKRTLTLYPHHKIKV